MKRILALDLATTVGWAFGPADAARPHVGAWQLPPAGADEGRYFAAAENEVLDSIALNAPTLIAAEAPLMAGRHRGTHAMNLLVGLKAIVQAACYRHEIRCVLVAASTARKAVLGTGRFPKGEAKAHVMRWARGIGLNPPTHDAADAALLWAYVKVTQP